jgi:2-Cys peroxiredoxin 5
MTSILASAAHNVAASLLGGTHIQPGAKIPAADVKEDVPDKATPLILTGRNILVSPSRLTL